MAQADAGLAALVRSPSVWLATVCGVGFVPVAPGTAGSIVGVLLFACTASYGLGLHMGLIVAIAIAGVWSAGASERAFGRSDDGRIVIDEVLGQLIALAPLAADRRASWLGLVTAFVAFRVFDIAKPGPVRWAERRIAGGFGVMADDAVAGVLAAGVVAISLLAFDSVGVGSPAAGGWFEVGGVE